MFKSLFIKIWKIFIYWYIRIIHPHLYKYILLYIYPICNWITLEYLTIQPDFVGFPIHHANARSRCNLFIYNPLLLSQLYIFIYIYIYIYMHSHIFIHLYLHIFICSYISIYIVGKVFANSLRDIYIPGRVIPKVNPRSSHTKDSKNGTWCHLA